MLFKLIKFGLVGASGLIIDFGTTYILKEWLKWNKYVVNMVRLSLTGTDIYGRTEKIVEKSLVIKIKVIYLR